MRLLYFVCSPSAKGYDMTRTNIIKLESTLQKLATAQRNQQQCNDIIQVDHSALTTEHGLVKSVTKTQQQSTLHSFWKLPGVSSIAAYIRPAEVSAVPSYTQSCQRCNCQVEPQDGAMEVDVVDCESCQPREVVVQEGEVAAARSMDLRAFFARQ